MKNLMFEDKADVFKLINSHKSPALNIGGLIWSESNVMTSLANGNIWGFFIDDRMVSLISYRDEAHAIEVDYLATSSLHQRSGGMSSIFNKLIKQSYEKSKPIWLEVSENNKKAISFYKKFFFNKVGIRPNYYQNGEAAIIYSYNP